MKNEAIHARPLKAPNPTKKTICGKSDGNKNHEQFCSFRLSQRAGTIYHVQLIFCFFTLAEVCGLNIWFPSLRCCPLQWPFSRLVSNSESVCRSQKETEEFSSSCPLHLTSILYPPPIETCCRDITSCANCVL